MGITRTSAMYRAINFIRKNFGLALVLGPWAALAAINVFDIVPTVKFRGVRFSGGDFGQYYMGGVVANEGIWENLYPTDLLTAPSPDKATITPRLSAELSKRGAEKSWKFIYPPPRAVFFAPLDWMPFSVARKLHVGLLFGSVMWFLVLFRRECDDWELPSLFSNLLVLAIGTGLPVCESVMIANATPFIALASILALRALRKNHVVSSVFAFALAGLFKGVSAAWVPALFLWPKWRVVVAGTATGVILLVLPHLLGAPIDLWSHFLHEVVPGSRKLYWIGDGNLGLPSFFAWMSEENDLSAALREALKAAQLMILALAYTLAWRMSRRNSSRAEGIALFVATVAFQLFSPICWPHYAFNVAGFLPLAMSTAGLRKGHRLAEGQWFSVGIVALAFTLTWFPIGNAAKYVFHAPILGFSRTFGYVLMAGWGLWNLSSCHSDCGTYENETLSKRGEGT